jgi:monooxygenase
MMLEGVPNFALAVGYTNASWTLKCDLTCQYVTRLLNRMHETGMRQCAPVNDDASVVPEPLLGLSSGYVMRSAHKFPKQGSRYPWRVYQSYLRDYRALRVKGIDDDAMVFSNPAPQPVTATAAAL